MLSRHFLRTKALQSIYSFALSGNTTVREAEKFFDFNLDRLNELGSLQLAALREVIAAGRQYIDDGLHKHLPSAEDLNPSYRVVDNQFLSRLFENFDYVQQVNKYQFPWKENADIMRKIYVTYKESVKYTEFIASPENDFANEQRMALDLFKCVINEESFRDLFLERSLLWEEDFDQIAQYNYAMLKDLDSSFNASTILPVMNDVRDDRDVEACKFARLLVSYTVANIDANEPLIRSHLQNWEFERVALMDIMLINMAISELINCSSIPERVTVDEYIELSKEFSTDKSKIFINGILDKLISELRAAGRINKNARGLFVPGLEENN